MNDKDAERHVRYVLPAWSATAEVEGRLGGARNAVWAVRIAGERYAARWSSRSHASLDWELALLCDLDRAGLWVPTPIPATDGRLQVDGLSLLTWLEGDQPGSEPEWRLVEETLRDVHAITPHCRQRPGFRSSCALLDETSGGDVQLDRIPPEVVAAIRAAWQPVADEQHTVIHGDPNRDNIRISGGRVGLLDWDEARVDTPLFDLAALPLGTLRDVDAERLRIARRASIAWEVANGWVAEPEYALGRLQELHEMDGLSISD